MIFRLDDKNYILYFFSLFNDFYIYFLIEFEDIFYLDKCIIICKVNVFC